MPDDQVFSRVVCGIDGSPEAKEAARQAGCLAFDGAHIFLVGVLWHETATMAREEADREAVDADLAAARAVVRDGVVAAATVSVGPPAPMLEAEVARVGADTVAVGSHGHGRSAGIVLGSVATQLIHRAACSVLVARATPTEPFPRSIAVGIDGSEPSRHALQKGRELALRTGAPLRVLHVLDGARPRGALQVDLDEEVEELTTAWSTAEGLAAHVTLGDLLVVGSRGLHGIRALGSVSEAVAHRAPSSVLIARRTDDPALGAA